MDVSLTPRRALLLLLSVVLLLVVWFVLSRSATVAGDGLVVGATAGDPAFAIRGTAAGALTPGAVLPIDVEITNPADQSITVSVLTVALLAVSAPQADAMLPCTVDDFVVSQAAGELAVVVTPGGTTALSDAGLPSTTWPQVSLIDRPVNQDGCKGATVTLAYTAAGTRSR